MTTSTERLRIAMISYYLPSGSKIGVGYQVHALANMLVARGHCVTVLSPCDPSPGAAYRTETVPLTGRNQSFKFPLRVRDFDFGRFDVLHAHTSDYWLWRRRAPVHIRTLHGSCLSEARWADGGRERLRMLALSCTELLATVVADTTVAVSDNTRRWLPWLKHVVPNGVDLSRFHPGDRSPSPSVLFVGTYLGRKRGKLLADVFEQRVLPALPDAELWMVCEDAPPGPGRHVLGRVSDAVLADLYSRAWAFCLPSTYEGFGIPYAEAMASGCPIVATPNPGALEITRGGALGLVVPDEQLGNAIVHLLRSPAERERFAEAGLQSVADYDLSKVAEEYESLYFDLLNARGSGRGSVLREVR